MATTTRTGLLLAGALAAALLLPTPATAGADSSSARVRTIRLDGVPVRWTPGTRQVITVNRTRGTHARITLWTRHAGHWRAVLRSRRARIGYGGLVAPNRRRQGSGTTPTGTYRLPFAFGGRAPQQSWRLPYRRVRPHDYWVEDNTSKYYNRYRSSDAGGFHWRLGPSRVNGSERLAGYPTQYEMAVVIAYNYYRRVHYRGAGIFLHVNGRGATAGCVSAPRAFLAGTLRRLAPGQHPMIAIGR